MPQEAIRHPKRGRTHRVNPDWQKYYWHEMTQCGLHTTNMTERIDVETTDKADRCKRCWPETAAGVRI